MSSQYPEGKRWAIWWRPMPGFDLTGRDQLTIVTGETEFEARKAFIKIGSGGTINKLEEIE